MNGSTQVGDRLRRAGALLGHWRPWRIAVVAIAVAAALWIGLHLPPDGVRPEAMRALGLTLFVIILWATTAVPQPYAAITFLALVMLTGTATPAAATAGFFSSALSLVFGGLLIGAAAQSTGFGRFVARRFLGRFRTSYPALLFGVMLGSTILSFLVPANMGRIAITVPVVLALAEDAGYAPGSSATIGLVLMAVIGNFTIALGILPANLLNIMIVGTGETLYGTHITYVEYFWRCAPVLLFAKAALVWASLAVMFRSPPPTRQSADPMESGLSPAARRVGLVLAGAIALWATDAVHGIPPGLVALAAGLLCATPVIDALKARDVVDPNKLMIIVWVGTVLSIGAILGESGAGRVVSETLAGFAATEGASPLYGYTTIALLTSFIGAFATIGATVPVVAATIGDIAQDTGLPLLTGVLSMTVGMSALFFPHEAAPIVVGLTLGRVGLWRATRYMLVTGVLTLVLILPLNALWWRLIGVLP